MVLWLHQLREGGVRGDAECMLESHEANIRDGDKTGHVVFKYVSKRHIERGEGGRRNDLPPTHSLRCCYITVDSATTALQNGACTYRCISKQMHYKTPFLHMKSMEIYENFITLFCLEKINFYTILC